MCVLTCSLPYFLYVDDTLNISVYERYYITKTDLTYYHKPGCYFSLLKIWRWSTPGQDWKPPKHYFISMLNLTEKTIHSFLDWSYFYPLSPCYNPQFGLAWFWSPAEAHHQAFLSEGGMYSRPRWANISSSDVALRYLLCKRKNRKSF